MRRTTTILRAAVAALTTATLLVACGSDSTDTTDSGDGPAVTPPPADTSATLDSLEVQRPQVGDCHRMTLREVTAVSADDTSSDCSHRPTTVTVAVGRLPSTGGEVDPESARAQQAMARTCTPRLARWLGTDERGLRLSRLTAVWFAPTPEQLEAGQRWFRCDLVGFGKGQQLLPLPPPSTLQGALGRDASRERYALCGTARPGDKGFTRTTCDRRHTWRAISTVDLPGGKAYPGTAEVRRAGDQTCSDQVRARQGQPLEFDYGWEWPTAAQWKAGQRYGYCWAPV